MLYGVLRTPLSEEGSWTLLRPLFPLCLFEGWGRGWLTFLHWGSRSQVWPRGQPGTERLGSVSIFHSSRLPLMDPLLPPPTPPPTPFFPQTQKGAKIRVKQEKKRGKEQREMGRWCPEVTRWGLPGEQSRCKWSMWERRRKQIRGA